MAKVVVVVPFQSTYTIIRMVRLFPVQKKEEMEVGTQYEQRLHPIQNVALHLPCCDGNDY